MSSPTVITAQDLAKTYRMGKVEVHALRGANVPVANIGRVIVRGEHAIVVV